MFKILKNFLSNLICSIDCTRGECAKNCFVRCESELKTEENLTTKFNSKLSSPEQVKKMFGTFWQVTRGQSSFEPKLIHSFLLF